MNQGRIWCVVNPTVGLPLFLGSVALTSLAVHASVLNNTPWMAKYWSGAAAKAASTETTTAPVATVVPGNGASFVVSVAPAGTAAQANSQFVVTVAPSADGTPQAKVASVSPSN